MIDITLLNTSSKQFSQILEKKLKMENIINKKVDREVSKIINTIKKNGDLSLTKYINKYDGYYLKNSKKILLSKSEINNAYKRVTKVQIRSLKQSMKRIKSLAKNQLSSSWGKTLDQTYLGEKITPIKSVGIYVPGGTASYPSTVMMNAIPAKVAGVKNIIMACPMGNLEDHSLVIVAADLCGISKIYRMGGAHAIGALAYGTKVVPKVDKIVGPGNIFVTLAKKMVFGEVGIDNIAGPSEILVIADDSCNSDWIAMDLFSQAEHDELAQPILLTTSSIFIKKVITSMNKLLPMLPRKKIILKSLKNRGLIIKAKSIREICNIANEIAPEHLEIAVKNNKKVFNSIQNAGAIFLGQFSPEVFGDYCAGPNHVLPTSGSAKFSSPLGVYDFQKRSSVIKVSYKTAKELSKLSSILAEAEGLHAHAYSARFRHKK